MTAKKLYKEETMQSAWANDGSNELTRSYVEWLEEKVEKQYIEDNTNPENEP